MLNDGDVARASKKARVNHGLHEFWARTCVRILGTPKQTPAFNWAQGRATASVSSVPKIREIRVTPLACGLALPRGGAQASRQPENLYAPLIRFIAEPVRNSVCGA